MLSKAPASLSIPETKIVNKIACTRIAGIALQFLPLLTWKTSKQSESNKYVVMKGKLSQKQVHALSRSRG